MPIKKIGTSFKIIKFASSTATLEKPASEVKKATPLTDKDNKDWVYFTAKAILADVPNGNGDIFPKDEVLKSYPTFVGKHIDMDHSTDPKDIVGKMVEAYPVEEDGKLFVEIVGKIDKIANPGIARQVEKSLLDSVSMEAIVETSECSICGHIIGNAEEEKCEHMENFIMKECEYEGTKNVCYSINRGITFSGLGIVMIPAEPEAKIKHILAKQKKNETLDKKSEEINVEEISDVEKNEIVDEKNIEEVKEETENKETKVEDKEKNILNEVLSKINALEYIELVKNIEANVKEKSNQTIEIKSIKKNKREDVKMAEEVVEREVETEKKEPVSESKDEIVQPEKVEEKTDKIEDKYSSIFVKKDEYPKSKWIFLQNGKVILSTTLERIWGDELDKIGKYATSNDYSNAVIDRIKLQGLDKVKVLFERSVKAKKTKKSKDLGKKASNPYQVRRTTYKKTDVKTEYSAGKAGDKKVTEEVKVKKLPEGKEISHGGKPQEKGNNDVVNKAKSVEKDVKSTEKQVKTVYEPGSHLKAKLLKRMRLISYLKKKARKYFDGWTTEKIADMWGSFGKDLNICAEKSKNLTDDPQAYCSALQMAATGEQPRESNPAVYDEKEKMDKSESSECKDPKCESHEVESKRKSTIKSLLKKKSENGIIEDTEVTDKSEIIGESELNSIIDEVTKLYQDEKLKHYAEDLFDIIVDIAEKEEIAGIKEKIEAIIGEEKPEITEEKSEVIEEKPEVIEEKPEETEEKPEEIMEGAKLDKKSLDVNVAPQEISPKTEQEKQEQEIESENKTEIQTEEKTEREVQLEKELQIINEQRSKELFESKLKEKRDKCAAIISDMLRLGMVEKDEEVIEKFRQEGKDLLDAEKEALDVAKDEWTKDLLAMDDETLDKWSVNIRKVKKVAAISKKGGLDEILNIGYEPQGDSDEKFLQVLFEKKRK